MRREGTDMRREGTDKVMRLSNEIRRRCPLSTSSLYLISLLNLFFALSASGATFDEQRAAMRNTVATQPESAIMSLLARGTTPRTGTTILSLESFSPSINRSSNSAAR